MNIEETKTYHFKFKFEGMDFDFKMIAKDQEAAVASLKKCLTTMLSDLTIHYPTT